jgi:hypothetical protein
VLHSGARFEVGQAQSWVEQFRAAGTLDLRAHAELA